MHGDSHRHGGKPDGADRHGRAILGTHRAVITVNGIFRPFALVRGHAVATWTMPDGEVVLEPFAHLAPEDRDALALDANDVVRYLAGE